MLAEEEQRRIDGYSVLREQQRYSNEQLWVRLKELYERELQILKEIPYAYHFAFSDVLDYMFWRRLWWRLILELEASEPLKDAIAWHLAQRGDTSIHSWLQECEEYKRRNFLKWQRAVWSVEQ